MKLKLAATAAIMATSLLAAGQVAVAVVLVHLCQVLGEIEDLHRGGRVVRGVQHAAAGGQLLLGVLHLGLLLQDGGDALLKNLYTR